MKDALVRFGVAMEGSLLEEFDALVADRGGTRSEVLRDLVRAEVTRARVSAGAKAVAALTLVYDHHVRDLTERLTDFQHSLGEKVSSTLHVHLDHDYCLEVIVMRGLSDELKRAGDRLLATRGVKHGGMELIALSPPAHHHHHHDGHEHAHVHGDHDHVHPPRRAKKKTATKRAPAKTKRA